MSWTQSELDALKRAYASGTLRVSYDGKTVEYGAAIEIHVAQHSTGDKVIRALALVALIVLCLDIFIWRP